MKRLETITADPAGVERLADAAIVEVEAELDERSGPRNAALKLGYSALNQIKPGFVRSFVVRLLPEAAPVMDVHLDKAEAGDQTIGAYLSANEDQVADELLAIVDARAEGTTNTAAKKAYGKLRPKAKDNVIAAMPRLAKVLERELA